MDTDDRPSVAGRAVVADPPGAGIFRSHASPVGHVGYRGYIDQSGSGARKVPASVIRAALDLVHQFQPLETDNNAA